MIDRRELFGAATAAAVAAPLPPEPGPTLGSTMLRFPPKLASEMRIS